MHKRRLVPYQVSLAGTLLGAREAVMLPIRPFLRAAGITEQQWRVLRVLSDERQLDTSTLAARAMLHAPSVTRIVKELVDRELIVRTTDPQDARRSILALTHSGENLVGRTSEQTLAILDRYAERFGADRLAALQAELRALRQSIEEDEGVPIE